MKAKILKKPLKEEPAKLINFRITPEKKLALKAKLKRDGFKAQNFWDQVLEAYLDGRLT